MRYLMTTEWETANNIKVWLHVDGVIAGGLVLKTDEFEDIKKRLEI